MSERTPCAASIGDDQRDLPKPGRRRGDRLRRRLDDHRRISDTVHIYLLVGNNVVLPHQGGIFLRSFATGSISLRNSWAGCAAGERGVVDRGYGLLCLSAVGLLEPSRGLLLDAVKGWGGDVAGRQAGGSAGNAASACRAGRAGV